MRKTIILAVFVWLASSPFSLAHEAIYVIDGDTIVVEGEHIRISNIDAPEILHYKCESELALGQKARTRMVALVRSGRLSIMRGDHGRMIDRYGRSLGRVLIDGRDIGEILIAEGLARRWDGRRHPWCP